MRSDNTVNAAIQGKAKLDAAFRQHMANKFPFAIPPPASTPFAPTPT